MIELPKGVVPNAAQPALIDYGGILRPALGGPAQRVDRMGNRYRVQLSFAPHDNAEVGRVVVSRLVRAKRLGMRVDYPLAGVDQGVPGAPVIDGAGQAGTSIAIRGLTPGYAVREGYWLSIEAADGQHYLHNVAGSAIADASGKAVLAIEPMLRAPFADGDAVHLARPMIEGIIDGDEFTWSLSVDHLVGFEIMIEEAA